MSKKKVLARNWKFFVETATAKTFERITGIESFTITRDKEDLDTTDFDNDGYDSHVVVGRSVEMEIEGGMRMDTTSGARCAGQSRVEVIAEAFLDESIGKFHVLDPAGTVYELNGSVKLADVGGGNKDKTSWGFTVVGNGKLKNLGKLTSLSGNTYNNKDVIDAMPEAVASASTLSEDVVEE